MKYKEFVGYSRMEIDTQLNEKIKKEYKQLFIDMVEIYNKLNLIPDNSYTKRNYLQKLTEEKKQFINIHIFLGSNIYKELGVVDISDINRNKLIHLGGGGIFADIIVVCSYNFPVDYFLLDFTDNRHTKQENPFMQYMREIYHKNKEEI